MIAAKNAKLTALDAESRSPLVEEFESKLRSRIVGQDRAVRSLTSMYQVFQAGLASPNRPIGTMLFLGPTGSGKTRVVEAAAEILFGDPKAVIKIDCAEYQHSHEIAKLIGSPPGYLGHRETSPMLTQHNLGIYHTERDPFTIVLFDEIEKASDALWKLLLGILDKGTLTLGDNNRVDFSQTMIFMTSNLGAKQMGDLITGSLGFAPAQSKNLLGKEVDQKLYTTAKEAARRHFSPEFMNRIDKVVVFRSLKQEQLRQILDLELGAVGRRLAESSGEQFSFRLTDEARELLLAEGTDYQYGARHLKRSIERFLVYPFANLLASGQARTGDVIVVDAREEGRGLQFYRDEAVASLAQASLEMAQSAMNTPSTNRSVTNTGDLSRMVA
ncbi:MAG TPA: AAA family ATPase [Blastocatellia bacterium]|nr:AAA family ATPase [Blastocatellia bacterium]